MPLDSSSADEAVIARLPTGIHIVTLVAGSHEKMNYERSSEYINGVYDFFAGRGFTVRLRIGREPDTDILFMSRAKVFVQGGGGYSFTIGNLARSLGNQVLCLNNVIAAQWCSHPGR